MDYRHSLALLCVCLTLGCQDETVGLEPESDADADADASSSSSSSGGEEGAGSTTTPSTSTSTTTANPTTATTITTTADESTATGDTEVGVDEPQTLLLALESTIAPGLPLQAIVETTPGPGLIDLRLQWLSLDVGDTTAPREPVGDPVEYLGIPVADDGSFTWETGELMIPGQANPITGAPLLIDAVAEVVPAGAPYCGFITGELLSPIFASLDGSTHAMTEVDPDALPEEFPVQCP